MAVREIRTPKAGISASVTTITPDVAREILARNTANRRISPGRVQKYAADMEAGRWELNGAAIVRDWNGNLIDGQHRLEAIIRADTAIQSMLIDGVRPEASATIDQGRSRSVGDFFRMRGQPYFHNYAAALKLLYRVEHDNFVSTLIFTTADAIAMESRFPGLGDGLSLATQMWTEFRITPSAAIVGIYLTRQAGPLTADRFESGLLSGADLKEGDARLVLRRFCLRTEKHVNTVTQKRHLRAYLDNYNAFARDQYVQRYFIKDLSYLPAALKAE